MTNKTKITENEMILEFLKAELDSDRFKNDIFDALSDLNLNKDIIENADLQNSEENNKRKEVFKLYREYENNEGLFEGFPADVEWFETQISKDELLNEVYYIDYSYWNEISNLTRLPKEAVKTINKGKEIYKVSNDGFINASKDFRNGKKYKKLILVTDGSKVVVLEGHLRITVYAMNSDIVPEVLPIILGYSRDMNKWTSF